jgi:hypothetical protein
MNKFYEKIYIYNKLNHNIQNIVLEKLFKQQKKWNKNAIKASIRSMKRLIEEHKILENIGTNFRPSTVKKIEIMYKKNIKNSN